MIPILEKKWTWGEFRELKFEDAEHFIYELFNGQILKRTYPSPWRTSAFPDE